MNEFIVKFCADYLMILIVIIGAWALLVRVKDTERYQIYARIMMAGLTSYAAAKIIALIYQPETRRPFEMLGIDPGAAYLNNPGFPSDHALLAMFLTVAVWWATRSKRLALILSAMTLIVCIGRVVAHVHTPLDVVGGATIALVGTVWFIGYKPNLRYFRK